MTERGKNIEGEVLTLNFVKYYNIKGQDLLRQANIRKY